MQFLPCAPTLEPSQCKMYCSHISRFGVWAIGLEFQPGVSMTKDFVISRLLYRRVPKHTFEAGVTVEGSRLNSANAAQLSGSQEPDIPHPASVCVCLWA